MIAFVIAYCIYKFGATDDYNKSIELIPGNLGYTFWAAFVFSLTVWWLNMYPAMRWKPLVMPGNAGNLRVNQNIFKVNGVSGEPNQPYVVLEDEGNVGKYNRANRSLTHFIENVPSLVVNWLLATFVFPFPAFVLMVIFCIGRVLHMLGYVEGYGKHAIGFAFTSIGAGTMEMLVFVVALRATCGVGL